MYEQEDEIDFDAECQALVDAHECSECGGFDAVQFNGPYTPRQEQGAFLVQCVDCGEVEPATYYGGDYGDHATRRAESGYAQ